MNDIFAFSIERVSALTGLTVRQLRSWDKTQVYEPELANGSRRQAYSRIYSFRDVVALRTLANLRRQVPLQELRRVGCWLKERFDHPWSSLRFSVGGRRVYFDDPATGQLTATHPAGQYALRIIELAPIAEDVRAAIRHLNRREPQEIGVIVQDRHVLDNAPVLAGTRIPTAIIWDFFMAGVEPGAILAMYPRLTAADIEAAISFERAARAHPAA